MVSLLDVNVLVALVHPAHVHHDLAHRWFGRERRQGWATCPVTENGFLRVALHQTGGDPAWRPPAVLALLRTLCASGHHVFWPDAASLRDEALFDPAFLRGPGQVTDVYLLGLAARMGGRLVTFDRTIPLRAVVGAEAERLHVIGERPAA